MADSTGATRPPQDRLLDRRAFVARMATLSAAAAGGALAVPGPALATGGRRADVAPAGGTRAPAGADAAWSPGPRVITGWNQAAWRPPARGAATDPSELTVAGAAALIRDGRLTPLELVDAYLARIERYEAVYQAFNLVLAAEARAAAAEAGALEPTGPLHGIPLALKDVFYTAGVPTTANSWLFQELVPQHDATVVARLRAAGAIVLGKTQTGPLATTRATMPDGRVTTVNAWAPDSPGVSPGGSSSGSATAVAGRLATSSIGTQTGGSITNPAAAQGLTGLKPTVGRVPLGGVIPLSYTRDVAGPIARDALDAAIMLEAMAGPDPSDPRTASAPPVPDLVLAASPLERNGRVALRWPTTIGVIPDYAGGDSGAAAARTAMLESFEALGARVVEVRLPDDWETLTGLFNAVRLVERAEAFLPHLRDDVRPFGVSLPTWINGLLLGGDAYLKGQRAKLLLLRRVLDDVFTACDVVVQTSPVPFDIVGLPLISFPIGFAGPAERPRPVGALLGGPPYGEERLLSLAAAYQAITEWHLRRPADPALTGAGALGSGRSGGPAWDRGRIRAEEVMDLSQ